MSLRPRRPNYWRDRALVAEARVERALRGIDELTKPEMPVEMQGAAWSIHTKMFPHGTPWPKRPVEDPVTGALSVVSHPAYQCPFI